MRYNPVYISGDLNYLLQLNLQRAGNTLEFKLYLQTVPHKLAAFALLSWTKLGQQDRSTCESEPVMIMCTSRHRQTKMVFFV